MRLLASQLEEQEVRVMIEVETIKWALDELQEARKLDSESSASRILQAFIRGCKARKAYRKKMDVLRQRSKVHMETLTSLSHEVRVHLTRTATEHEMRLKVIRLSRRKKEEEDRISTMRLSNKKMVEGSKEKAARHLKMKQDEEQRLIMRNKKQAIERKRLQEWEASLMIKQAVKCDVDIYGFAASHSPTQQEVDNLYDTVTFGDAEQFLRGYQVFIGEGIQTPTESPNPTEEIQVLTPAPIITTLALEELCVETVAESQSTGRRSITEWVGLGLGQLVEDTLSGSHPIVQSNVSASSSKAALLQNEEIQSSGRCSITELVGLGLGQLIEDTLSDLHPILQSNVSTSGSKAALLQNERKKLKLLRDLLNKIDTPIDEGTSVTTPFDWTKDEFIKTKSKISSELDVDKPQEVSVQIIKESEVKTSNEMNMYIVGKLEEWNPRASVQVIHAARRADSHFEEENASKAVWHAIHAELKRTDSEVFQKIYDI